jgi:hypothetical protein
MQHEGRWREVRWMRCEGREVRGKRWGVVEGGMKAAGGGVGR